jgi:pimeloyl-ACP methyl ester carboxylesterase
MALPAYYPYRSANARNRYLAAYDEMAKDWPVPPESRMVPTSWGETFVRMSGPSGAPPLVLLPGMASTSLIWSSMITALSARYRTYAIDRNGDVGRSTSVRRMHNVDDLMSWLDELFTALLPRGSFHLGGLSYGGWLTAQYALRFPQRLSSIVLVAPGATVLSTSPQFILRGLVLLTSRRGARSTVHWLMSDLARRYPARLEVSLDRLMLTLRSLSRMRPISATVLTDQQLQSLRMPALYLVGENEKIYSPAKAVARLQRVAPQIQIALLPQAGHDLTIAQPDRVTERILEFLGTI